MYINEIINILESVNRLQQHIKVFFDDNASTKINKEELANDIETLGIHEVINIDQIITIFTSDKNPKLEDILYDAFYDIYNFFMESYLILCNKIILSVEFLSSDDYSEYFEVWKKEEENLLEWIEDTQIENIQRGDIHMLQNHRIAIGELSLFFQKFIQNKKNPYDKIPKVRFSKVQDHYKTYRTVFDINIRLLCFEENFVHGYKSYQELKEIENRITSIKRKIDKIKNRNSSELQTLQKILNDKCSFFHHKMYEREHLEQKSKDRSKVDIYEEKNEVGFFDTFSTHLKQHYISKHKFTQEEEDNFFHEDKVSFKIAHKLTKKYKDYESSEEKINDIFSILQRTYSNNNGVFSFDHYALQISLNYIQNNAFSLAFSNLSLQSGSNLNKELDNLKIRIQEKKHIDEKINVYNFFPYYKAAQILDSLLEKLLDDFIRNTKAIDKALEIYEISLIELGELLGKNEQFSFLPFQLPYDESVIEKYKGFKVFSLSSFMLQVDYRRCKEETEKYRSNFFRHKATYNSLKISERETKQVQKRAQDEIQQSINESNKSITTVLGIFSALAFFTGGTIQVFNIKNVFFNEAIIFILAIGATMSLFISLLLWLVSETNKALIGLIPSTILMVLLSIYLVFSPKLIAVEEKIHEVRKVPQGKDTITTTTDKVNINYKWIENP